jgi:hypothetical protein
MLLGHCAEYGEADCDRREGAARGDSVLAMAVDETVAVPLPGPRLNVRVIALLKAKRPGRFEYLQGMRQGT